MEDKFKFKVNISDEINGVNKEILEEYWSYQILPPQSGDKKNGRWSLQFFNKTKDIIANYPEYDLSVHKISQIVKHFSVAELEVKCKKCDGYEKYILTSTSTVMEKLRRSIGWGDFACGSCKEEIRTQFVKERQEKERIELLAIQKLQERQANKRVVAIEQRLWEHLDEVELNVLKRVLSVSTMTELWGFVFMGNPYDKSIWATIKRLENLGLITTIRGYKGKLLSVTWNERLSGEIMRVNGELKTIF